MSENVYVGRLKRAIRGHMIDKENKMPPVKISKSDFQKYHKIYSGTVEQLINEVREYQAGGKSDEKLDGKSSEFTDYRIASYNGDMMGKVLTRKGEIYRGIYREKCGDFLELWNTGFLQVLGAHGFIPETTITEYCTKEYGLILHHEKLEMSASNVWTFSMIRDACIHEILINDVLKALGFKLHDGHLNNLTFHEGKPVFTDIGSIVKDEGQEVAFDREVVFTGCYRLLALSLGNSALSRIQVYDENNNAIWLYPRTYDDRMREYRALLKQYKAIWRFRPFSRARRIASKIFDAYDLAPEYIMCLFSDPVFPRTMYSVPKVDRDTDIICDAIKKLDFSSALLIGSVDGRQLKRVLELPQVSRANSAELDFACAEITYKFIKENNLKANVYLYHHLYGSDSNTRDLLTSDLVIANDITDQVMTAQKYRADSLCHSLAKMTRKYAVVTFYPYKQHKTNYVESGSDTTSSMMEAFESYFNLIYMTEIGERQFEGIFAILLVGEKR